MKDHIYFTSRALQQDCRDHRFRPEDFSVGARGNFENFLGKSIQRKTFLKVVKARLAVHVL